MTTIHSPTIYLQHRTPSADAGDEALARPDYGMARRFALIDQSPGGPDLILDDNVDLADFLKVNDLEPDEVNRIGRLEVGEAVMFGGGAAPLYALRRME